MSAVFAGNAEPALLGIGSNLGDRAATLRSAVDALRSSSGIEITSVSTFIETAPVGNVDQPAFLNGAVLVRTTLAPRELLDACLRIEAAHGRDRERQQRWGPRTLDIDLLLFGDRIIHEPGLHVPHPRLHERLFALQPAVEIAGETLHPVFEKPLCELLARLAAVQINA